MKKHLLFICTANLQRSPTAEGLFKKNKKYDAKSAGTQPLAVKPITKQAVEWADIIIVMEKHHKEYILYKFPEGSKKKVITLNIPDIYYKDDPVLIKLLNKKLRNHNIL